MSALIVYAWNWHGKVDRGCLHAALVSRYAVLKRGMKMASETVVIDISFFTGICLAIRGRVGAVIVKLYLVLRQAPKISTKLLADHSVGAHAAS